MPGIRTASSARAFDEELVDLPVKQRTGRLLEAAHTAGPAARAVLQERVIEINMPIAAQLVSRYRGRGVPTEDLEQVAYLALLGAVRRFDYAPERDFLSFAVPSIRGEIKRYFRDLGWTIRPTRPIQTAQAAIAQAEGDLLQQLGRSPRPSEIAVHLGLEVDVVVEALAASGLFNPSSLDSLMASEDGLPWEGPGITDLGFGAAEARAMLRPLLADLTRRERLMLEMRFFRGSTQAEIGEAIGVTQMQVSRVLSALMARLRDQLTDRHAGRLTGEAATVTAHSAA